MSRACFLCGDRLVYGASGPQWVHVFFLAHRRKFTVRVCTRCFAGHDMAEIWQSLTWMHEEEGREIGQGP